MKNITWKAALPAAAAIALFLALALIYFSPVLEGKRLVQGDVRNWQGMAQEIVEHRDAHGGEEPLWTGSMFSGMPAYQISVLWKQNLLLHVDRLFHGFLPRPAGFLFLYLIGMYIFLRCLRVDPWLSILGAIAYAFSSYFFVILEAGHTSKANAIGYAPAMFGGFWLLYRGRALLGAALFALFLALEIAMNHVQITYYFGIVLLLFVLAEAWRAIREKQLRDFLGRTGLGALAVLLALLCNAGLLWSTYAYGKYTTRGKSELTIVPGGASSDSIRTGGLDRDYVTDWSYGRQESWSLLVPDIKGGASGSMIRTREDLIAIRDPALKSYLQEVYGQGGYVNSYFGDQRFTGGPVYVGAVAILLMLLLLGRAEGKARWWILGAVPLVAVLFTVTSPMIAGLLVMAYLIAGIFLWRDPLPYALFSGALLALMLGWGRNYMPLTDLFLDHVPGYDKFRAVTIILTVCAFCIPALGVIYLDRIIRNGAWDRAAQRRFLIPAGVLALLLLAMAVTPATFTDLISDAERDRFNAMADGAGNGAAGLMSAVDALKEWRAGVVRSDAWRGLLFVAVAAAVLFAFGRRVIDRSVLIVALGLLLLIDQWGVAKRFVNNEKDRGRYLQWEEDAANKNPFKPTPADMAILQAEENDAARADLQEALVRLKEKKAKEKGRNRLVSKDDELLARFGSLRRNSHFRVFALRDPFNDSRVSYFHKSIGGYHGAKLKRYQELIEFHLGAERGELAGALNAGTNMQAMSDLLARQKVLNMLNARYLIADPAKPPIRNLHALGPAWFVDEVKWVSGADEEITAMSTFDPATTAIVDERWKEQLGDGVITPDPSAEVTLDRYAANELHYTVNSGGGGVVVFSEIWYGPDWRATIDGTPAEYARANYVLRAMRVPAGKHEVVFSLVSKPYSTGGVITLAGSSLLILLVLAALALAWKRTRGGATADENA